VASNLNGLAVWPDAQNGLYFANLTMPVFLIDACDAAKKYQFSN